MKAPLLARLRLGRQSEMNKTEQMFALRLEGEMQGHQIRWFEYEPIKLKLARKCFYTPDFGVFFRDATFGLYEVKGFWRDDARVKIKTAARLFPFFRFWAVTKTKEGWDYEEF
jgi:hypothetical protein